MRASASLPSLHGGKSQFGLPRSPEVRNHSAMTDTPWNAHLCVNLRTTGVPLPRSGMPVARHLLTVVCVLAVLTACAPAARPPETASPTTENAKTDAVMRIVRDTMAKAHLKAVIVRVTIDGQAVVTQAVGE